MLPARENHMTDATNLASAETMPEGEMSPLKKARLPAALQFAGAITFLAGALPVALIVGVLLIGAYTVIERLIRKGIFRVEMEIEWGAILALLMGIVLILAARGIFALKKVWRVLVLIALWLTAPLLLYSLVWACREIWLEGELSWQTEETLVAATPLFMINLIMIVLLTCRSTTVAFGASYSRLHKLVVWSSMAVVLVMVAAGLIVLVGQRRLAELGLPL